MRVLLAAEADHIQDLIFRSSRLREVTGGSHALETFWARAEDLARLHGARSVPVKAGGTLRVLFEGAEAGAAADAFERDLRDLYAIRTGGHLSVACAKEGEAPQEPADARLESAAGLALLRAKAAGDPPAASPHMPWVQPCASCGRDPVSAAVEHPDDSVEYLCGVCHDRSHLRDTFQHEFLREIRNSASPASPADPMDAGAGAGAGPPDGEDAGAARAQRSQRLAAVLAEANALPRESEEVGAMDARGRVAYLLADGNGFGARFERATREGGFTGLTKLSRAVAKAGRTALVAATAELLLRLPAQSLPKYEEETRRADTGASEVVSGLRVPVLPLITGGDDVFALVPAPWAFWFAQRFADAFTGAMDGAGFTGTTLCCALVFAKGTFPYRMAHRVGEEALRDAKRASRAHGGVSAVRAAELRDTVSHGVPPLPGEVGVFALQAPADAPAPDEGAGPGEGTPATQADAGEPLPSLDALMGARAGAGALPRKRLHQVEALFSASDLGTPEWTTRLEHALERARLRDERAVGAAQTLRGLGGGKKGWIRAPALAGARNAANATVDLLHLWDYLQEPGTPETGE
ncbi:MAG: hypothetical protein JWM27_1193 [Gemmatimonadetes bacterium]|nr:hypothetical protein [Gemmatimonadota bacterium]